METDIQSQKIIANSFFHSHPLALLATIHKVQKPETAAVYFHIEPDCTCYFFTKEATRKYANLTENPNVTLSVYDEAALTFGEIAGEASVVTDAETLAQILPKLHTVVASRKNDYWVPPIAQLAAGSFTLFRVVPLEVRLTTFGSAVADAKPAHIVLTQSDLSV